MEAPKCKLCGERHWALCESLLVAACLFCRWTSSDVRAIDLAEEGKLFCWRCREPAILTFISYEVRRSGVETELPATVHEEMASGPKATK